VAHAHRNIQLQHRFKRHCSSSVCRRGAVLLASLLTSLSSAADVEVLTVRQTFHDRQRLVAEIPATTQVQVGDEFLATLEPQQQQCSLRVVEIRTKFATLDSTHCRQRELIRPSQRLEKSLLPLSSVESSAAIVPPSGPIAAPAPSASYSAPPESENQPMAPRAAATDVPAQYRLIDLGYFPEQNEKILIAGIHRTQTNLTEKIRTSTIAATVSTALKAKAEVAYGISDRLATSVTLSHSLTVNRDLTYGPASTVNGTSTTEVSRGLYDPEFKLRYLALDEPQRGFRSTLGIMISPSVGEYKVASSTSEGTVARGGHEAKVSGNFVRKGPVFAAEMEMSFLYRDRREGKSESSGRKYTFTGQDVFSIAGGVAVTLSELTVVQLGLAWNGVGSGKIEATGANSTVIGEGSMLTYQVGVATELVPNQIAFQLAYIGQQETTVKAKNNNTDWDLVQSMGGFFAYVMAKF